MNNYRKDIEGLRGLAVILVVLYHINDNLISGGFIGVDVFFVISGFLITSIVCNDILNGEFKFSSFYARRIKRILPLMFAMVCVVFIVGYFLLIMNDLWDLAGASRANLFYVYNFYLLRHSQDYFSLSSQQQPLLHTWSLAVEEQFYFLLPLTLFLLSKISKDLKITLITFTFLFMLSLMFSIYCINFHQNDLSIVGYYMLSSRAYELLLGCILAITINKYKARFQLWSGCNNYVPSLLSLLGLVLIISSSVCLTSKDNFPGLLGLWPTIGAGFFILGGSLVQNNIIAKLLSNKIILGCGVISYSLYLWHWPVLAFYRYETSRSDMDLKTSLFLIFIIVLLSVVTYICIEKPIKKQKAQFKIIFVKYQLIPIVLLLIPISYVYRLHGVVYRPGTNKVLLAEQEFPHGFCFNEVTGNCVFGLKGPKATVAVFGDSHAASLSPFFNEIAKNNQMSIHIMSAGTCVPLVYRDNSTYIQNAINLATSHKAECKHEMEFLKSNLDEYQTIVLIASWGPYLSIQGVTNELIYTLNDLKRRHKHVIIVGDIPRYQDNGSIEHIQRRNLLNSYLGDIVKSNFTPPVESDTTNDIIRSISEKYSNVYFLDTQKDITSQIKSYPFLNNYLLYVDSNHLNVTGSIMLAQFYATQATYRNLINVMAIK
ncbi:MAG: acyltransferase [Burkholderiales bacterium]|nr:acyltransferase [Burkholderiales bacterium]